MPDDPSLKDKPTCWAKSFYARKVNDYGLEGVSFAGYGGNVGSKTCQCSAIYNGVELETLNRRLCAAEFA